MMIVDGGGPPDERFEAMFRKYYGRVYRYFCAVSVPHHDADDLAQETFARVWRHLDQIRLDDAGPYLMTTAKSVLLNDVRARQALKRKGVMLPLDDPELLSIQPVAPPEPDFDQRGTEERQQAQVRTAVASLPAGQRECVKLWIQGKTYDEIAKILKVTLDAVKSRLRDAKRTLRDRLGANA